MSPQMEFLKGLIDSAQSGNEGAIAALRRICANAAQQAPATDLITLAQCFLRIGIEATHTEAMRN